MAAPLLLLWSSLLIGSSLQDVLRLTPDQSQFFPAQQLLLRCLDPRGRVLRNTSRDTRGRCDGTQDWGFPSAAYCKVAVLKIRDSGRYWCESAGGATSEPVTITVTGGVALQMPVHPVPSGKSVSLTCRHHTISSTQARFYRDGSFLSDEGRGTKTFQQVAPSDEGRYTCEIRGQQSAPSWLRVLRREVKPAPTSAPACPFTALPPPPPPASPSASPLPLVVPVVASIGGLVLLVLLVLTVLLIRRCRRTKGSRAKRRRERPPQTNRSKASSRKQKKPKLCPKCRNSAAALQPLSP